MAKVAAIVASIITGLEASLIKDREEAVRVLRELLMDRAQLRSLVELAHTDTKIWLGLFQALFSCVAESRNAVLKVGTKSKSAIPSVAATNRLSLVASTVRLLVQQSAPLLGRKVVRIILAHLSSQLEHKGTLFAPIALDYIKALRSLFSFRPHLEHLDPREWEGLLKLAFAGVFQEDIKAFGSLDSFTQAEAAGEDLHLAPGERPAKPSGKGNGRATIPPTTVMDIDSEDDGATSRVSDDDGQPVQQQRKRKRLVSKGRLEWQPSSTPVVVSSTAAAAARRRGASATPSPFLTAASDSGSKRVTSLEQVALMALIRTVLQSPTITPILGSVIAPPYEPEDGANGQSDVMVPAARPPSLVAPAVLFKLLRFLSVFLHETSAHVDVLASINSVLFAIQLNSLRVMHDYTPRLSPILAALWVRTRNRELKEQVLIAWKLILPFLETAGSPMSAAAISNGGGGDGDGAVQADEGEAVELLEGVLDALEPENDARFRDEPLSLDNLRLIIENQGGTWGRDRTAKRKAFCGGSFKYGANFSSTQAMAWATLELRADVIAGLISLSRERSFLTSSTPISGVVAGKRRKLLDPLEMLLDTIDNTSKPELQTILLQTLLFLIDRHWSRACSISSDAILKALLGCLNSEDSTVLSWSFIALAAIATEDRGSAISSDNDASATSSSKPAASVFASPSRSLSRRRVDVSRWEQAWNFAVRRMSLPAVSRAACHAGHAIVVFARVPPLGLLESIETFTHEIEVLGPAAPHDAVCAFLGACLEMASRDVRLFRMELEDRVVTWLLTAWKVAAVDGGGATSSSLLARGGGNNGLSGSGGGSRLERHAPGDLLCLLARLCRFSKSVNLLSSEVLTESPIVSHCLEEVDRAPATEFIVHARLTPGAQPKSFTTSLPPFSPLHPSTLASESRTPTAPDSTASLSATQELGGRPRRLSSFLQRSVESIKAEWVGSSDAQATTISVERVRRALDMVVIALGFEALIEANGFQSNRRTVKSACYLLEVVRPALSLSSMSLSELAVIVQGLEPLVETHEAEDRSAALLLSAGPMSGIRRDLVPRDLEGERRHAARAEKEATRSKLLMHVWRSSDLQDTFAPILSELLAIVKAAIGHKFETPEPGQGDRSVSMGVDEDDDFGPTPVAEENFTSSSAVAPELASFSSSSASMQALIVTIVTCLVAVPALQSGSTEPTRRKDLFEFLNNEVNSAPQYLVLSSALFRAVRLNRLYISSVDLLGTIEAFGDFFTSYAWSRDESMAIAGLDVLDATKHVWLGDVDVTFVQAVNEFLGDFLKQIYTGKLRSCRVRTRLVRFCASYFSADPKERFWKAQLPARLGEEFPPVHGILQSSARDLDVSVRLEVAQVFPSLFSCVAAFIKTPFRYYNGIHTEVDGIEDHEYALTTSLLRANMVIVSTSARKAAYLHLLVTGQEPSNLIHSGLVLQGAADALGFTSLFRLWEVYSPAIYGEFVQRLRLDPNHDLPELPESLLGYSKAKKKLNSDMLLRRPGVGDFILSADQHELFGFLCRTSGAVEAQARAECLPRAIAIEITACLREAGDKQTAESVLQEGVLRLIRLTDRTLEDILAKSLDTVVAEIIAHLVDPEAIRIALLETSPQEGERRADAFARMTASEIPDVFDSVSVIAPRAEAKDIIRGIDWILAQRQEGSMTPETVAYNVLLDLATRAGKSPLIVEQIRFVYAIGLLASYFHQLIRKHLSLATTFLHLSAVLMAQADLAPVTEGFVIWGIRRCIGFRGAHPGTTELFVQIAHLAESYADLARPLHLQKVGDTVLAELERTLSGMLKKDELRPQAEQVLSLWPRPVSAELAASFSPLSVKTLGRVLTNPNISTAKFSLVRRFRDLLPTMTPEEKASFAREGFWRLRSAIPPADQLIHREADIDAFADILFLTDGVLQAPSIDAISSLVNDDRIGPTASWLRRYPPDLAVKAAVFVALVDLLDASEMGVIDLAYQTLRVVIVLSTDLLSSVRWPTDVSGRIPLLAQAHVTPNQPSSRKLANIMKSISLETHHQWLSQTASFLAETLSADDAFFGHLSAVFRSNPTLAERLLPHLVQAVLLQHDSNPNSPDSPRAILSGYFSLLLRSSSCDSAIRRSILNVILHLRHSAPSRPAHPLAYNTWLDVDWLLLGEAAVKCKTYTTALLFLETRRDGRTGAKPSEAEAENALLYEIYTNIEDPDGFYGIAATDARSSLVRRLHHEDEWSRAFGYHGADFQITPASSMDRSSVVGDVVQSLHSFGFDKLAMSFLQGSRSAPGQDQDIPDALGYDLAWRTDCWDIPVDASVGHSSSPGASVYAVLKALHRERSPASAQRMLEWALRSEVERMRALGIESMTELNQAKTALLCLRELRVWSAEGGRDLALSGAPETSRDVFTSLGSSFGFSDVERIGAVRLSLLRSLHTSAPIIGATSGTPPAMAKIEKDCHLRLSEIAREADRLQVAVNSVTSAQRLEAGSPPSAEVSSEFACVLWRQGEHSLAIRLLSQVLEAPQPSRSDSPSKVRRALTTSLLGEWTSTARLDHPEKIRDRYFDVARHLADRLPADSGPEAGLVYRRYAVFAEEQYRALAASPEMERIRLYQARIERELAALEDQRATTSRRKSGVSRAASATYDRIAEKRDLDREMLQKHDESKGAFLRTAIAMYSKALAVADEADDSLIRLCSLFLSHHRDDALNTKIGRSLSEVPSHKFIPLLFQMSSRLGESSVTGAERSPFQDNIHAILLRLATDHPFHSLYQLLTLRDSNLEQPARSRHRPAPGTKANEYNKGPKTSRTEAASDILRRMAQSKPANSERLKDVDRLTETIIDWAWTAVAKSSGEHPIRSSEKILKIQNVNVPVPTAPLAVDLSLRYESFVRIASFKNKFRTSGGINEPKVMDCLGDDGREYKQLHKGGDDMRQDAVMEQLFVVVNGLLDTDRQTRSRSLRCRTYVVIPLARLTGILEFVVDTTPIGVWLRTAHKNYNPKDVVNTEIREAYESAAREPVLDSRLQKFERAMTQWHPVMRHFFTEKQKEPSAWFSMRLAYARSLATTSMIGHVIGLGDRHVSNILIDTKSGELVHIDLGIAFEQGKALAIPELVPFRLTNDFVDGLGMSKTDGVFRRCSEETLRVLRASSATLMTLLEVLRFDPLQKWVADAEKQTKIQGDAAPAPPPPTALPPSTLGGGGGIDILPELHSSVDEAADRALQTVRNKLHSTLNVEYTVNQLIHDARNPANLYTIFIGWQPWL